MTGLYRATVSYDGTDYAGFQIQENAPTIQGAIEKALHRLTQERVRIHGAGRTDAGVHAVGQVISFQANWRHGACELERALNAVLPRDIGVRKLETAPEGFHARYSAWSREYIYRLYGSRLREPLLDRFAWQVAHPLDVEALQAVIQGLPGERDWGAFGPSPSGGSTRRWVYAAEWSREPETPFGWADSPPKYAFRIVANGFLRGMVRRLVGTLLLVGAGQLGVAGFQEILESGDMSRVAAPAPACGLCLWQVGYTAENEQGYGPSRTGADGLESASS
jgi:tRNA pseudouridine38-40 synthase